MFGGTLPCDVIVRLCRTGEIDPVMRQEQRVRRRQFIGLHRGMVRLTWLAVSTSCYLIASGVVAQPNEKALPATATGVDQAAATQGASEAKAPEAPAPLPVAPSSPGSDAVTSPQPPAQAPGGLSNASPSQSAPEGAPPVPDAPDASSAATPPAPADSGEDVVEVIEIDDTTGPSAPTATAPPPPVDTLNQYRFDGWLAQRLQLTLRDRPDSPAFLGVPYDRLLSQSQLFGSFNYKRGRDFQAVVSGFLPYTLAFHRDADGSLADGIQRGSYDPRLQELYFGVYWPRVDLRIGKQRIAWGRADSLSPNDVLNARDQRDPFPIESQLRHIPTPSIRADLNSDLGTLQGVLLPFFVPDTFDVYGSNWALIQDAAPDSFRALFRQIASIPDGTLADSVNRTLQQTRVPPPALKNLSAGARLSTVLGATDIATYYFYGFDRTPYLSVDPTFGAALQSIDFSTATASSLAPVLDGLQAGARPLAIEYQRNHHAGFDLAQPIGPIAVVVDAAYDSNRVFYRSDLTGFATQALQGTLSLEHQTGDIDKVLLVEGSVLHLPEESPPTLLFHRRTTLTLAGLARYPLVDSLIFEVRGTYTASPSSIILRPLLRWDVQDNVSAQLSATWINGKDNSLGRYFRHNTNVQTTLVIHL